MLMVYLDASTCHLRKETFNSLNENKIPYSYHYPEGVFITVPDLSDENNRMLGISRDLQLLLQWAWDRGVKLIRLDADGEIVKELPVYEWNEFSKNEELAKWIVNCICNKCDEKRKRDIEKDIANSLNKKYIESIKLVLERLCEEIEELKR